MGVLGLGAALVLPVATLATSALAVFLVLRSALQAPLSTISYPLAETGARLAGIGGGTAIGLVNLVWASAAVAGPLVGGGIAEALGARFAFGCVAVLAAVAGAWILARDRRVSKAAAAVEYS